LFKEFQAYLIKQTSQAHYSPINLFIEASF